MAKSTSIAKITKPRLPDVLPRTRLFRLLDRTRKTSPVIWVSGPAGSGKTTLIANYLDAKKLSCLWYQADGGDNDIGTFFYYMSLAAKKAGSPPGCGGHSPFSPFFLLLCGTVSHTYT